MQEYEGHVGYIELIDEPSGCLRYGADGPFPIPWKFSVHFKRGLHRKYVEIFGYDHDKPTPAQFEFCIGKINREIGRLVDYWRIGNPPVHYVQIDPTLIGGRILMTRAPLHISHAIHPETGAIDKKAVAKELRHVADLLDSDHLDLRAPALTPKEDGWNGYYFESKYTGPA